MRADMRVVAAFAVLAGAAAAQQTTRQPAEAESPDVERTAVSEQDDQGVVENFLDWLKRHADEPDQGNDDYWDRHGGGDGGGRGGGGDGGGGGGHGG